MTRLVPALLLLAALVSGPSRAATPPADEAIFVEGVRYSAVLSQESRAWRLLPTRGDSLQLAVADSCRTGAVPPRGLWLLTQDAQGRPELLAPSATALPAGHAGRLRVVACGTAAGNDVLPVPPALLGWLQQNSGVIYVAP
jgi:hypothetical protein